MRIKSSLFCGESEKHHRSGVLSVYVILILSVVISASLSGCTIAIVRPLDPQTGKAIIEEARFDAERIVEETWASQVIPYVNDHATQYNILLNGLRENPLVTQEQYGLREGTNPYNFLVTGTGTVLEVDTSSLMGVVLVDTAFDGVADLRIQIGPVIRGSSLRDALPFFSFAQFTNQLEHADISKELHNKVRTEVLAELNQEALVGKRISFSGAFTLDSTQDIILTPVIFKVGE